MKIKQLLEYQFPTIQNVNVKSIRHPGQDNFINKVYQSDDVQRVGGGMSATAYHNPQKTPHDVRKISGGSKRRDIDGFYYYILELETHSDNTNPYFPRFRAIKVYTDRHQDSGGGDETKDHITYSVQMEKLTHLRGLSNSEKRMILFRLFGDRQHRDGSDRRIIQKQLSGPEYWGYKILSIIRNILEEEQGANALMELIVDEDFKNAISFLKNVYSKSASIHYDIHDDNVMIRRTPYGPQLVFLDPFN